MSEQVLEVARTALAGRRAWLVGGAIRDRELGRKGSDVDVMAAAFHFPGVD